MGADLERRKAVVGGLLVEMAAMRLPNLFAAREAAQQGDGGVHQVIERQQDRGSERAGSGKLQQHPADEKADRQRTHIAEEEPRDGLVERGEAEERAAEGEGDERDQGRQIRPTSPSMAMTPVTGTISATVIQSSPSMKLTRFTNQTPPRMRKACSTTRGTASGRTRRPLVDNDGRDRRDLQK